MGLRDQFHEKARQLAERAGAEAREAREDVREGSARRAPDAPGTPGRPARNRPAGALDDSVDA
ncbi:hypothetical protein AMK16_23830 [Streptomyces sp. CB00455]|uniref:hypothetical protein n=1 Tax=Streptomyces sp. CB00455 TaxID=1703927 RepID=UPI00093BD63A|nr:hypothetical protein [Streptomyces sp. CB00455]OKK16749.1 hypothetical protein AMK16_23830 [Streptomyces sp. CB00455]